MKAYFLFSLKLNFFNIVYTLFLEKINFRESKGFLLTGDFSFLRRTFSINKLSVQTYAFYKTHLFPVSRILFNRLRTLHKALISPYIFWDLFTIIGTYSSIFLHFPFRRTREIFHCPGITRRSALSRPRPRPVRDFPG